MNEHRVDELKHVVLKSWVVCIDMYECVKLSTAYLIHVHTYIYTIL